MRRLPLIACLLMPVFAHAQDADLGKTTFMEACATCHGIDADGAGPMTDILTVPVPGLTDLTARNDGVFPWLRVVHVVDGRTGLRGHGGAMPLFGSLFKGDTSIADAPDGSPVLVSERVLAVVEYLESIQQ